MSRKYNTPVATGRRILVVDDDQEYLAVTKTLLEGEGHSVTQALNGAAALELLKVYHFDLILIDYYMPHMTGEQTVVELRKLNTNVQVIFQTGYASEQPPRDLIRKLEIQGYYNKSEGPEQLLLWVDVGLKAASHIQQLNRNRRGLNYILNATYDMHKIQTLTELLQGILLQVSGLLEINNSFLAVLSNDEPNEASKSLDGFVAIGQGEYNLVINAGMGKYSRQLGISNYLSNEKIGWIKEAMEQRKIILNMEASVLPLFIGSRKIGAIYFDNSGAQTEDLDLLNVLSNQASAAIYNTSLYQRATFDPLTKVYLKGLFLETLNHELSVAYRTGMPLALLVINVEGMKEINDSLGHLSGDEALQKVGEALFEATRRSDVVGRIGGDEFAVILPCSSKNSINMVANRFMESLGRKLLSDGNPIGFSMGACMLSSRPAEAEVETLAYPSQFFHDFAERMLQSAKRAGIHANKFAGQVLEVEEESLFWTR